MCAYFRFFLFLKDVHNFTDNALSSLSVELIFQIKERFDPNQNIVFQEIANLTQLLRLEFVRAVK